MYSTLRRGRTSETTTGSTRRSAPDADIAPAHDGRNTGVRVLPSAEEHRLERKDAEPRERLEKAVMVVELYQASKEAGASEQKAQAAAQAMADDNTRFDQLETEMATGLAEVKAQITMLKWMNGIVIAGVAALIIKTFFS
jgi:hypothetical protein